MPTPAACRRPPRPSLIAAAFVAMLVALAPSAAAQAPVDWGGLQPVGPLPPLTLPAVFTVPPIGVAPSAERGAEEGGTFLLRDESGSRKVPPFSPRRPAALVPLYLSFAGLQSLDAISTLRALDDGHDERNPVVGWLAQHPGALVAAKAGVAAGTVYLSERLWKKNRTAAVVLMVALNGAYAAIVANNHAAGR